MALKTHPAVIAAFDAFPDTHRAYLLQCRDVILDAAQLLEQTDGIEETLKWGQPSYLPVAKNIGTAVRLGVFDERYAAMYVNCQTTLLQQYRLLFDSAFKYSGHRALLLAIDEPLPEAELGLCVSMAMHYHLDKRRGKSQRKTHTIQL